MKIVVAYRGIPQAYGWATGDAMVRAFRTLGHDVFAYGNYYQTTERLGELPNGPDLLVYMECCDADPQYAELTELRCPKIYWEFDTAIHKEASAKLIRFFGFDHVFMANWDCHLEFGAKYLPYGVDPELFYPLEDADQSGAAIIGSPFGERQKFADAAGLDLVTGKFQEDYADAIRNLAVHVHYLDSGGRGMVVARPLETMASGVCLLAEDTQAMRRHWVPGIHYEAFTGPGDCMEKVCALMANDARRKKIARAGYSSVMSKHTYLNRARAILAAL